MKITEIIITDSSQLVTFSSRGNPLITNMLQHHPDIDSNPGQSLTDTLDTLLADDLLRADQNCDLPVTLHHFRELSLVNIPFRDIDVEKYLYPETENSLQITREYIGLLVNASLARYESKGYVLDKALSHLALVEYMITKPTGYAHSHFNLLIAAIDLQTRYPESKAWYDNILPDFEIKLS